MLFANLQLSSLLATAAKREFRFGHYLRCDWRQRCCIGGHRVPGVRGRYNPVTAAVIIAVGLPRHLKSISDAYFGLLQQHHRLERVSWSLMLRGAWSVWP